MRNEAFLQGILTLICIGALVFIVLDAFNNLWIPIISLIVFWFILPGIICYRQKISLDEDGGFYAGLGLIFVCYWIVGILSYYFKWEITGYVIMALTILSFVLPVFIWPKK